MAITPPYYLTPSSSPPPFLNLQCPENCVSPPLTQGGKKSPNGDLGMDGLVSTLAHELSEVASDPYMSTWYDEGSGMENADVCAYQYGTVLHDAATGAAYNMQGNGGIKFLVQQIWSPGLAKCASKR